MLKTPFWVFNLIISMKLDFYKYQGTGNDFVMIDQREQIFIQHNDQALIRNLCDRRFGIGADGLILLEKSNLCDFNMVYFNADGKQSTLCGNGGRCIIRFGHDLGLYAKFTTFEAVDGMHKGRILDSGKVSLQMSNTAKPKSFDENKFELNTGSPHLVIFCDRQPESIKDAGAKIRYSPEYTVQGINVNFVLEGEKVIDVATYERGVEDETYSCGTGVAAAALALSTKMEKFGDIKTDVETKGGSLSVTFRREVDGSYSDIWLTGPATMVFKGSIDI